jgi:hypothetical protein
MFSVIIKTSDYEKLEINGHPVAGYSFLNLIFSFMVNASLQILSGKTHFIVELLTGQRLNGKDVPAHAMKAYRVVKV